ncbi:MAG: hypothetical protein KF787_02505 [Phycisphaeraceae bacterium]|nr:hypothetical protein [Phycisphaerae bacterium]MBX3391497.1 hypothetical protein [Phycisphaeraceae bacterium]HRJ49765.1 hypothetical protein [Phycisphaerales bacterium]
MSFDSTGQRGVGGLLVERRAEYADVSAINRTGTTGINHRDGVDQDGGGAYIARMPRRPREEGR